MFFHRSSSLHEHLESDSANGAIVQNGSAQWAICFCSSEMPKSVTELHNMSVYDVMNLADCGIQAADVRRDQTNKDVIRIVDGAWIRKPFGTYACGYDVNNPFISLFLQNKSSSLSTSYTSKIKDIELYRIRKFEGNFGGYYPIGWNFTSINDRHASRGALSHTSLGDSISGNISQLYYNDASFYLESQEPQLLPGLAIEHVFNTSYNYYMSLGFEVSYEVGHTTVQTKSWTEQTWENLASGAKVRIRNVDAIPKSVINKLSGGVDSSYLRNHCILEKSSTTYFIKSIYDSHSWVTVGSLSNTKNNSNYSCNFDHGSNAESLVKTSNYGRFTRIYRNGSQYNYWWNPYIRRFSVNGYNAPCTGNAGFNGGFDNYPHLPDNTTILTAEAVVKWGFLICYSNNRDCNSIPYIPSVPLMMFDVGGPNDGKAVSLADTNVSVRLPPSILNAKFKIGWLEGDVLLDTPTNEGA